MLHTIDNGFLRVTVSEQGAELQSILGSDGTEYLWQGDPRYWSDRALNLFPYVARLVEGSYLLDGRLYHMDIHGIAPYRRFALVEKSSRHMVLELRSDASTLAAYPRAFTFQIHYRLEEHTLTITFAVENRDNETMYFGLGGHPGFNVPVSGEGQFEDYRLRFEPDCAPVRVGFSADCFVNGQDTPFPLEGGTLPLRHSLFDQDAIVLKDMSRRLILEGPGGPRVTVSYPDMPYLGIWHWPKTDAPYVCIEPWRSLPAREGGITVLEQQPDLVVLEPGGQYKNSWSIQIHPLDK